jgi:hypothetical protein
VVLGGGARLFDHLQDAEVQLEQLRREGGGSAWRSCRSLGWGGRHHAGKHGTLSARCSKCGTSASDAVERSHSTAQR